MRVSCFLIFSYFVGDFAERRRLFNLVRRFISDRLSRGMMVFDDLAYARFRGTLSDVAPRTRS